MCLEDLPAIFHISPVHFRTVPAVRLLAGIGDIIECEDSQISAYLDVRIEQLKTIDVYLSPDLLIIDFEGLQPIDTRGHIGVKINDIGRGDLQEPARVAIAPPLQGCLLNFNHHRGDIFHLFPPPGRYPRRPLTNASGSKIVRSSGFSPNPANKIGRANSFWMAKAMPPWAEESNFARMMPVTPTASLKALAWARAF